MDKKDKEEFYSPPPKLGTGEQVLQFIWNPETKQFLGRTAGSWCKYYIIDFSTFSFQNRLRFLVAKSRTPMPLI